MGSMEASPIMSYLMQIMQEGKVDPLGEGLAVLHAMGMKIDESSLGKITGSSGSSVEKQALSAVIGLYNEMGFIDVTKKLLLDPAKKGYNNPLLAKAPTYDEDSLKTAVTQYGMFVMLGFAASMFKQFQAMVAAMEKSLGPGKESESPMKKEVIDVLNKIGKRESFDPYMHATILCYSFRKDVSPANVAPILASVGVKADAKRLEKTCALVSKANMPELVKAQIAYLKELGE